MLVVVMMVVKRKAEIKMKPGALRPGDDGHGDDGDGDFGDDRKALVMIILPMITITVKRSRAAKSVWGPVMIILKAMAMVMMIKGMPRR